MAKMDKFLNTLAEALEMPKDVMLNLPRITLVGHIQLQIENHRGVVAYDGEEIRISLSKGELKIVGNKLTIRTVDRDEIIIDGAITSIEFKEQ